MFVLGGLVEALWYILLSASKGIKYTRRQAKKEEKKKRIKEWQPPAALKNVKRKKNRNRTQFLQVKAELCLSFKDKQTTGANDQIAQ